MVCVWYMCRLKYYVCMLSSEGSACAGKSTMVRVWSSEDKFVGLVLFSHFQWFAF